MLRSLGRFCASHNGRSAPQRSAFFQSAPNRLRASKRYYAKINPLQNKQIFDSLIKSAAQSNVENTFSSAIHEELARRKELEKRKEKGKQGDALKIGEDELRELTFDHLAFDRALDSRPIIRASEDAIQKLWDSSKYDELLAVTERIIAERKWERSKTDKDDRKFGLVDQADAIPRINAEYSSSLKTKVFLLQAAALARLDRAAEAILAVDQFNQVVPDARSYKREVNVIKASCLGRLGKFDEAIAVIDEIIELEQPLPTSSSPLVSAAMRAFLEDEDDVGIDSKTDDKTSQLKEEGPKTCDKEPYLLKAQVLLMAEKFSDAIETAKQALAARPRGPGVEKSSNARANSIIASCYRSMGDFTNAIKFSTISLELDPTFIQAAVTKAQALVAVGEIELALKLLDASARAAPKRRTPLMVKGVLLMILGQHQAALDTFDSVLSLERAVKPHPNQSLRGVILGHKSRIYLNMQRIEEAEKAASEAVSAAPTNPLVLIDAARAKLVAQKPADALTFVKAAEAAWNQKQQLSPSGRSLAGSLSDLYMLKAGCLSKLERFSEGLEAAKKAVELDPNSASALLMLGRLQERSNRLSDALDTFTRAQKVAEGPNIMACWSGLAAVYNKLGNQSKARECMAKAAMSHPQLKQKLEGLIELPQDAKPNNKGSAGDFSPVS